MGFTGRPGPMVWNPSYMIFFFALLSVFHDTLHVYMHHENVMLANQQIDAEPIENILVFYRVHLAAMVWKERVETLAHRFILIFCLVFGILFVCVFCLLTVVFILQGPRGSRGVSGPPGKPGRRVSDHHCADLQFLSVLVCVI